jgi:phosphatidylinositol 3-kinase
MDSLFKRGNWDFKFTIYDLLALSTDDGIMAFVNGSTTVQQLQLDHNRDLQKYLSTLGNDKISNEQVVQNWIDTCAGYAVATYILAIGDRHLENLMVTPDGKMFHIDFGFIFGVNPPNKGVFVPEIRINCPMIDAMGGQQSENYKMMKKKCVDSFLYLRNYRNLLVNTVLLMADAGIPNLPVDKAQERITEMD